LSITQGLLLVYTDKRGSATPLLLCSSSNGYVEVVRALLEAGADVNKRDSDGRSPLYYALKEETWHSEQHKEQRRQGEAQVAALLREAGAQELQPHELENLEESEDEEDDEDDENDN